MQRGKLSAILATAAVGFAALATLLSPAGSANQAEITPLDAPLLQTLPQFHGQHVEDLLWGSYRSGLYLGLRMRVPKSLLVGLAWFDPDQPGGEIQLRHEAQSRDGLIFGWEAHDGRSFGRQELVDGPLHLTTHLMKHGEAACGHGGDWAVRVTAQPAAGDFEPISGTEHVQKRVSLIFYVMDEAGSPIQLETAGASSPSSRRPAFVSGYHPVAGSWEMSMHLQQQEGVQKAAKLRHLAVRTLASHNITDLLRIHLNQPAHRSSGRRVPQLPNEAQPAANLAAFQVTLRVPGKVDLIFLAGQDGAMPTPVSSLMNPGSGLSGWLPAWVLQWLPSATGSSSHHTQTLQETCRSSREERLQRLQGSQLTNRLQDAEAGYAKRVADTFGPLEAADLPPGTAKASNAALSNMLGGLGYFYGASKILLAKGPHAAQPRAVVESWPAALYTGVPSRSFFPRGFLWDEGFHQLLVHKWDPAISRDVLAHWLDLINSQGWIAREQILGQEARARVPEEFMVQNPDAANPPTLFLVLADMARGLQAAAEGSSSRSKEVLQADADFLRAAWPRLTSWLGWFQRTQQGPVPGSYRWRGRDNTTNRELNPKTLESGLDDFPRASHPSEDERHLDLRCWMALAYQSLATIGKSLALDPSEVQPYTEMAAALSDPAELVRLHWAPQAQRFLDWGNHTEGVTLQRVLLRLPDGRPYAQELQRIVDPERPPQLQFVPHFGFVSLFPLLMRLLPPDSPQLAALLQALPQADLLWSPYGLRSLGKDSPLYNQHNTEHDAPYWRGAVWFNINYLALAALQHYSQIVGPAASSLVCRVRQRGFAFTDKLAERLLAGLLQQDRIWRQRHSSS
ncbi:hypothetical protein WJX84_010392 [Apatococcus fuscideae]|uniref:Mannosyl-oligosaccharide glucosidase n=1 Tax=Apatococcus fuscideae TaxID=2026836 RepID=A0AAW1T3X9_9CHLO